MKIFCEKDYQYLGRFGNLYAFRKRVIKHDPELVLVHRAKYAKSDGSFTYFDPTHKEQNIDDNAIRRLLMYARKIEDQSVVDTPQ